MSDARNQAIAKVANISAMVAALNVDYDRLGVLRRSRNTPRFVAGWNMSGYMPDGEPASFDSVEDARGYIADEMEVYAEMIEGDIGFGHLVDPLLAVAAEVRAGSGELGVTVGNYHYWVTQDGNMLEQEDAEELAALEEAAGDCGSEDDARERIQVNPLSVEYRSDWVSYGEEMAPSEFRVVLCAGGPHVEIVGGVDLSWIRVLYRDWGDRGELFDFDRDAVVTYCQVIGVGEF